MIGVESGHAIGSSLAILRTLYELGVRSVDSVDNCLDNVDNCVDNVDNIRYMTLTHGCNTPWADAAQVGQG